MTQKGGGIDMLDKQEKQKLVLETIKKRRSTRRYEDLQVDSEILGSILEAGRYAPSGGNSQSCHFIVIRRKALLTELVETVQREFAKMEYDENTYKSLVNSIRASKKGNYVFHYGAPTLVVVANQKDYGNAMADSACAIENMMIMAAASEVGSCWINQLHWLDGNEEIRKIMEREGILLNETICGALSLGYEKKSENPVARKALERKGNKVTFVD